MHPNPAFRQPTQARNIAFAREQGFGLLCVGTETAPLISHIPFLLSEDGALAEFHLVRSNPIVRRLEAPQPARLAVQGPHGYVSPDWYGIADQVPTWNYVAVHLVGRVARQPRDRLRDLLDRQSAWFESRLSPKPAWSVDKMSDDALARMMRQIVPCTMVVEAVEGTWKLSQNKPDEVRLRAADGAEAAGQGQETTALAGLMRGP